MATPDLAIRISAELTEVKAALATLRSDLRLVGAAAQQAGRSTGIDALQAGLQRAVVAVRNLVAAFAGLAVAGKFIAIADEISTLNARLRLVTRSQEDFNRAQVALFDLAQRTRSSLGETIDLYTRIAQATKDAGVGQETLLQIVETINQAVQLSGASAQAANAALVQLGQGLGSGTLRGEELNSVLEQTPALADAIAKGMGITRGELRQYGEQGKITAEAVIAALQRQRDEVRSQFEQLPLTVGQAITRLRNAGTALIGIFDQASSSTRGLAGVIDGLATFLSSDRVLTGVAEFAASWGNAFSAIVGDAKRAIDAIRDATRDFLGTGDDLFGLIFTAIRDLPTNLRTAVRTATVTFAGMIDSFVADAKFLRDAFLAIFTDDTIEAALQRRNAAVNAAAATVKEMVDEIIADGERAKAEARKAGEEARRAREAGRRQGTNSATGGTTRRLQPVLDTFALTKDAAERGIREIEALYQAAEISLRDYLERRTALQLQAINAEIASERRKLDDAVKARKQDDANKAATNIARLQAEAAAVERQRARDEVQLRRQQEDELLRVRADRLEQEGRLEDAARLRLQQQYRDLLQRLRAEGDRDGEALVNRIVDTEVSRARFAELKQQADAVIADLQAKLAAIRAQRDAGQVGIPQAEEESRAARQQAIDELRALAASMRDVAAATGDPALQASVDVFNEKIRELGAENAPQLERVMGSLRASLAQMSETLAQSVTDAGVDALTQLFVDLTDRSKTAGEAVKDFVRGFAQSMAQIAARALATYAVLQLLDAIYPGLGRAAAASMSVGTRHTGGIVDGSGPRRTVPAWVFAAAPRFHGGGMVGLKPGEVPIIAQMGEEVLSRDDPRNRANGGGAQGVRIINAVDPNIVGDYMTSAAGERVLVNVIQRNRGAIRQVLA